MNSKKDEILQRQSQLSPAKKALLQQRLSGKFKIETHSLQSIPRRSNVGPAPVSFAQQRLWFLHQLDPDSVCYNIPVSVRLTGAIDAVALEQTFNEIVRRHEILRTTFKIVDGKPVQDIAPALAMKLPVVNLRDLPETARDREVQRLVTEDCQQLFDLASGPLLRSKLLQLDEQEHLLLFVIHHIISDGWSAGVLIREIAALYSAFSQNQPSPLPELPIQYADFAIWQRQWLQGDILETQLAYWKQQLGSTPPVLELPTDRPRSATQTTRSAKQLLALSPALTEALKTLSQQEGVTLFMTLLAAFKALLFRYRGQEDIVVGSPIANRNRAETEGLIGFLVNTLVLRTNLSGNPNFREILQRVRELCLGAYAHQDLPFEKLVQEMQPERNLGHPLLFPVWFVLQNSPVPALKLPGVTLTISELDIGEARNDLKLDLTETPEGIKGFFEYKTDLFEPATIARMAELFQLLLNRVVEQPDIPLDALAETLAIAEQQQQLSKEKEFQEARRQKLGNIQRKVVKNSIQEIS